MMRARLTGLSLVFAVTAAMLFSGGGFAQDKKDKKPEVKKEKDKVKDKKDERGKANPSAAGVDQIQAAYELAEYGRKAPAAEALIVAARLLGTANIEKGKFEPKEKKEPGGKEVEVDHKKVAEGWIDDALKLSKEAHIKKLADITREIVAGKERGPISGRTLHYSRFLQGKEEAWFENIVLRGGEQTKIFLYGQNGADMDFWVYGQLTNQTYADRSSGSPNESAVIYPTSPILPGAPVIVRIRVRNYSNFGSNFNLYVSGPGGP